MHAMPLDGFTVGVTADRRSAEQCEMLRRRGARVVLGPTVTTLPLAPEAGLRAATEALVERPADLVLANTGVGVRGWFAAAASWGVGAALVESARRSTVLARGPKAAGAVLTAGLSVAWRSPSETMAETVDEALRRAPAGSRIAVQLDGGADQPEVARLHAAGLHVVELRVYEWSAPADRSPALRLLEATCARRVDAVTFTSAAAVTNLVDLARDGDRLDELLGAFEQDVVAMCVGPVCARVMRRHGARCLHPERPRLGAMVHALVDELGRRRRHLRLGAHDVVVQGTTIRVADHADVLTERERSVLDVLMARPGAVVSKAELLRAVWDAQTDAHVLEVTIGRLRRRLGPAGPALRTVVRRGYCLEGDVTPAPDVRPRRPDPG